MAKFIPNQFPELPHDCTAQDEAGYQGELKVYQALKEQLSPRDYENWVVFHSWKRNCFQSGWDCSHEVDFIILIPNRGVVFLEVKNWNWAKCHLEGGENWYYHGVLRRNPLDQLRAACKAILGQWKAEGISSSVPYSNQVVLVNAGNVDLDPHYFLYGNWQDCLPERIENNFSEQARTIRFTCFRAVYDALMRCRYFSYDVAAYARQLEAASASVDEMMYMLRDTTTHVHVKGLAGTGKTVVAIKECLRVAEENMRLGRRVRILFLCFNRGLYCKLQEHHCLQAAREIAEVKVARFHKYVKEHFSLTLDDWDGDLRDYSEETYRSVCELLQDTTDELHYDYIFVDEAQDFKGIWFDEVIKPSLAQYYDEQAKRMRNGKLYVFSDQNQTLYDRVSFVDTGYTVIRLRRNLRNSIQIAKCGNEVLTDERAVPLSLTGAEVVVHQVNRPEARAQKVSEEVRGIRSKYGDDSDIVILTPSLMSETISRLDGDMFQPIDDDLLRNMADGQGKRDSSKIPVYTIKAYKGLEADFVILTDIPGVDTPNGQGGGWYSRSDFYVACTRAKFSLTILPVPGGYGAVKELVERSTHQS